MAEHFPPPFAALRARAAQARRLADATYDRRTREELLQIAEALDHELEGRGSRPRSHPRNDGAGITRSLSVVDGAYDRDAEQEGK